MYVRSSYSTLGLLASLALASCGLVGCGDDDDGEPPDSGIAGKGGRGGDGESGRGGTGPGGRGGTGGPVAGSDQPSCREMLDEAGPLFELAGAKCDECLCNAKAETLSCTGDCAKLVYCVSASSCMPSDTPCVRRACEATLGGTDAYMKAVMQVARTPFFTCASACFSDDPDAGS